MKNFLFNNIKINFFLFRFRVGLRIIENLFCWIWFWSTIFPLIRCIWAWDWLPMEFLDSNRVKYARWNFSTQIVFAFLTLENSNNKKQKNMSHLRLWNIYQRIQNNVTKLRRLISWNRISNWTICKCIVYF